MSIQHFSTGARFHWQESTYEVLRLLPGNQINIENIPTGAVLVIERSILVQALFDGELRFAVEGKHANKESQDKTGERSRYIDLSDCPEKWVAIAKYRLQVIQPLLGMENRTLEAIQKRVQEIKSEKANSAPRGSSVSVASIYRWIKDYANSNNDIRSLIPATHKCGNKGKKRLAKELEEMIDKAIQDKYYVREKVSIKDIRDELAVRIAEENRLRTSDQQLLKPSESTLARRIKAIAPYQRIASKRGARVAKREFSQYGQTEYPSVPLERVEIDHTTSDLIVIDDRDNLPLGRLTLTYCLDMATRYPLGYYLGFEPPSYLSVMECLYHAIRPKENVQEKYDTKNEWLAFGVPGVLMVDNAKEFIGHDLEDACLLLGIVLQQAPVKTPHFKAGIERKYRSLNTMFFHTLPGTTFSNARERGDYDSAKQACVYLSEIDKMLTIFIVDIYAQQFHRGLSGIPARRWAELTKYGFAPGLPPSAKELSILLGRTDTRIIHHYGIEFSCLRYNCEDLVTLRTRLKREKAKIKYHPADLSQIYVYDPFEKKYIHVPALDQDYTQGLSLWKHQIIKQTVLAEQDKVDIVALGQAKRKIQEIVEQGRQRKRQKTRVRIARWETAGKSTRQFPEGVQTQDMPEPDAESKIVPLPRMEQIDLLTQTPDTDWEIVYREDIFRDKNKKDR